MLSLGSFCGSDFGHGWVVARIEETAFKIKYKIVFKFIRMCLLG